MDTEYILGGTLIIVNLPSFAEAVPYGVLSMITFTPGRGSPVVRSVTIPVSLPVVWPNTSEDTTNIRHNEIVLR